jgi:hypothetical protein
MADAWFFIVGMPVGGLALYLFYQRPLSELEEAIAEAKRGS